MKLKDFSDAMMQGDSAKVEAMLKSKPELVFRRDKESRWTLLHFAVDAGRKDVAELLLAHGAEVNAKDKQGDTPLWVATFNGHKDVVELLLAKGAEINIVNDAGDSPLHLAVLGGHKNMVEFLLTKGAKVNALNNSAETHL